MLSTYPARLQSVGECSRASALERLGPVWDRVGQNRGNMPRLLLFAFNHILVLLNAERMVAAKGGVSICPHQHNLQPSLPTICRASRLSG